MPISFPANPTLNQQYTFSDRTWIWNGAVWQSLGTIQGVTGLQGTQGTIGDDGIIISSTAPVNTGVLWLDSVAPSATAIQGIQGTAGSTVDITYQSFLTMGA